MPKKATKRRNAADLTLRNLRALKKRVKATEERISLLEYKLSKY